MYLISFHFKVLLVTYMSEENMLTLSLTTDIHSDEKGVFCIKSHPYGSDTSKLSYVQKSKFPVGIFKPKNVYTIFYTFLNVVSCPIHCHYIIIRGLSSQIRADAGFS